MKVRVAVAGTIGKSVVIDTAAGATIGSNLYLPGGAVATLESLAAALNATTAAEWLHSQLQGLQDGNDHPQYPLKTGAEIISGLWNFTTIPQITGISLPEYIEDTIGGALLDSSSINFTYGDTANTITASIVDEYVEDLMAATLLDSPTIAFDHYDTAGQISAHLTAYLTDLIDVEIPTLPAYGDVLTWNGVYWEAAHAAYVDQSVAYSWTGVHTFSNDVNMSGHLHLGTEEIMVVNGVTIHGQLEINSDTASIQEVHTHSDTNNSVIYFARSRGTNAAPTIVQSGDYLGVVYGVGYDGTDYALGAGIGFVVDGTPGANDMPTRINFATSPDGSQTPVVRLSVRAAGNLTIAAPDSGIALQINSTGAAGTAFAITGAGSTTLATLTDATQAVWRAVSDTVTADFMTTTAGAVLRATSNHPLVLRTNNTDRITMAAAGNVTIAAPSSGVQLALANYTGAPSLQWGSSGTLMSMGVYNAAAVSDLSSYIFTTDGVASGIYPSSGGNVVIQARSSAARSIALVTGTTAPAIQLEISTTAITSLLPHLNAAGTVGAPAFSFSGDPNTGLYSVGADQFGIAVGGSAVVTVTTAGLNLVDASASGGFLSVSAGNTTTADFRMAQGGVNRWIFRKTGTAESGANVGSDFVIIRRADDGSQIANALTIARSTGNWSLGDATANPTFTFLGTGAITTGGNIELGHASDTTLARVSAGVVSIEGVNILTTTTGAAIGITLTAGAGLTGGGNLSANRTFTVGAGNGITVNADDVALNLAYAPTWTATHVFQKAAIAVTSTDGVVLENPTASTSGVTAQWSPRLHFIGHAWKSNATAVDQVLDWIIEAQPVTGAAAITGGLVFSRQIAGGGYSTRLTLDANGATTLAGSSFSCDNAIISSLSGSAAAPNFKFSGSTTGIHNGGASNTLVLSVNSTDILTLVATSITAAIPFRLKNYTVATLPAGTAGFTAYVTDALAPVFGAAVVGGGAVTVPVYYTGAAWFVG